MDNLPASDADSTETVDIAGFQRKSPDEFPLPCVPQKYNLKSKSCPRESPSLSPWSRGRPRESPSLSPRSRGRPRESPSLSPRSRGRPRESPSFSPRSRGRPRESPSLSPRSRGHPRQYPSHTPSSRSCPRESPSHTPSNSSLPNKTPLRSMKRNHPRKSPSLSPRSRNRLRKSPSHRARSSSSLSFPDSDWTPPQSLHGRRRSTRSCSKTRYSRLASCEKYIMSDGQSTRDHLEKKKGCLWTPSEGTGHGNEDRKRSQFKATDFPLSEGRFQKKVLLLLIEIKDLIEIAVRPTDGATFHVKPANTEMEFKELESRLVDETERAALQAHFKRRGGVDAVDLIKNSMAAHCSQDT